MEFCIGGELADHLKQQKFFDEEDTKIIILRIANAVAYLHKKGYLFVFILYTKHKYYYYHYIIKHYL